jgi:hypothetical protein
MFILELTLRSWYHAEENKRRTLQRNDIAAAIMRTDIFDFLVGMRCWCLSGAVHHLLLMHTCITQQALMHTRGRVRAAALCVSWPVHMPSLTLSSARVD